MRLLRFPTTEPDVEQLTTKSLILRQPHASDFAQWSHLRGASREFLQPWEPKWAPDELSRSAFRSRIKQIQNDLASGRGRAWFLTDKHTGLLLGGIALSNIRRGVTQAGTLGYWMGEPHAGKGYMSEAVAAVSDWSFSSLSLNRVEAATVLENEASQRLLIRCGFEKEGLAKAYLKINGQWRDHYLFARLAPQHRQQPYQSDRA